MKISDFPPHVQKNIVENPTDYRVAGLHPKESEPNQRREGKDSQLESGQECRGFCIKLIQFRRRLLDTHDNARASLKAVVDRITERLGFRSDDDRRLEWQYGQFRTDGAEGVLVMIEPTTVLPETK